MKNSTSHIDRTKEGARCPECGARLEQIRNDPANRWQCPSRECWFHATPMPRATMLAISRRSAGNCPTCNAPLTGAQIERIAEQVVEEEERHA